MDFSEYQEVSYRAVREPQLVPRSERCRLSWDLDAAASELAFKVVGHVTNDEVLTPHDFEARAGEVLRLLARLCRARGVDLQRAAENNIARLEAS